MLLLVHHDHDYLLAAADVRQISIYENNSSLCRHLSKQTTRIVIYPSSSPPSLRFVEEQTTTTLLNSKGILLE